MSKVTGEVSHLLLQTTDIDRLEEFYIDVVGFHVNKREMFDDNQPLVVLKERLGLTEVEEARANTGQAVEHIAFQVPNIDTLHKSLQENGVMIDDGPKPTPYGTSIYFFDPDGNRIECHD